MPAHAARIALLGTVLCGLAAAQYFGSSYGDLYAVVPAGVEIPIQTGEEIDIWNAVQGRSFPATVQADVRDADGRTVIPRGSAVSLVVRCATGCITRGSAVESGQITLALDWVQVGRKVYWVERGEGEPASGVTLPVKNAQFRAPAKSGFTICVGQPLKLRKAL